MPSSKRSAHSVTCHFRDKRKATCVLRATRRLPRIGWRAGAFTGARRTRRNRNADLVTLITRAAARTSFSSITRHLITVSRISRSTVLTSRSPATSVTIQRLNSAIRPAAAWVVTRRSILTKVDLAKRARAATTTMVGHASRRSTTPKQSFRSKAPTRALNVHSATPASDTPVSAQHASHATRFKMFTRAATGPNVKRVTGKMTGKKRGSITTKQSIPCAARM